MFGEFLLLLLFFLLIFLFFFILREREHLIGCLGRCKDLGGVGEEERISSKCIVWKILLNKNFKISK